MEDELLPPLTRYEAFDIMAATVIGPLSPPGRFSRWLCRIGWHAWGMSHCRVCGKKDGILCSVIDEQWEAMSPEEQKEKIRIAAKLLVDANERVHGEVQ